MYTKLKQVRQIYTKDTSSESADPKVIEEKDNLIYNTSLGAEQEISQRVVRKTKLKTE